MLLALVAALPCATQGRYTDEFGGWLRGFTKEHSTHIIHKIEKPFIVRKVEGVVLHNAYEEPVPMSDVVFEIRGPGESEKVRGVRTDKQGRFRIKRVAPGKYLFKAGFDGFNGVVGTVIVSRQAESSQKIEIRMEPAR